ncbi:MAG: hypothetical protein JO211_07320 [Acidobacteriaceae bacterium]|nr:hypothetical protein [Acidobacteriaceae bacterium]
MGLELANESAIEALPGNASGIQGYDADLVIVDEGGFVGAELLDAITPSLATTDGRLVFAGRPNGEWGPFYEVYAHGVGWEQHIVRADESPLITPGFLASERARMSEREFAAQYLCDFASGSGRSLFGSREEIEAAFLSEEEAGPWLGEFVGGGVTTSAVARSPSGAGVGKGVDESLSLSHADRIFWESFHW